jgi:Fic/DOC family
MTSLTLSAARAVIAGALEGKYDQFGEAELERQVTEAWGATELVSSENDLMSLLHPTDGFSTDVINHVVVLRLIELFWRKRPLLGRPICYIHQAIYGVPGRVPDMRKSKYVGDFGGAIPTEVADMRGALVELELIVERLTPVLRGQAVSSQAVFLAHIFSSIIRVHAFSDGNGRAARMTVQYCLRLWDRPYLPLPKVRNVPTWHNALERAVTGDQSALVQEFISRMTGFEGNPSAK